MFKDIIFIIFFQFEPVEDNAGSFTIMECYFSVIERGRLRREAACCALFPHHGSMIVTRFQSRMPQFEVTS